MSKLSKFIIVLALAFILISNFSYIYAATPNMNLGNTTTSGNTTTTTTSSSVTASNFDLELTNILCIVLIVVGVLLILLGFAILLRLKG